MTNEVIIGLRIDDKGQLVATTKRAKQASSALGGTQKAAQSADRALKGAAQASSSSTKNFSKLAQGITGGLVPAYATLAANIFAISAAFNFFRNQADLQLLERSQISFAQNTGVALGTVTERLREASDGLISFQQASQAAAIGVAKGFSGAQLESLAEGARKAATALGRDFEDTFDRLVRGVSKAEPELLDELGITLRLETATKRYADSLGIAVDQLTEYQRSQAVLLETQRQLEQFSQVAPEINPYVELSRTFEEIVRIGSQAVLPFFNAFASLINSSAPAAITIFGALGLSIAKAALPIDSLRSGIDEFAQEQEKSFKKAERRVGAYGKIINRIEKDLKQAREEAAAFGQIAATDILQNNGGQSSLLRRVASGEDLSIGQNRQLEKALRNAEKQFAQTGRVMTGIFKNASARSLQDIRDFVDGSNRSLRSLTRNAQAIGKTIPLQLRRIEAVGKRAFATLRKAGVSAFKQVGAAAKATGRLVDKAFKLAGIIGFFTIILELGKQVMEAPFTIVSNILRGFGNVAGFAQNIINFIIEQLRKLPVIGNLFEDVEFEFGDKFKLAIDEIIENDVRLQSLKGFEEEKKRVKEAEEALESFSNTLTKAIADSERIAKSLQEADPSRRSSIAVNAVASLDITSFQEDIAALEKLSKEAAAEARMQFQGAFQAIAAEIPALQRALDQGGDFQGLVNLTKVAQEAAAGVNTVRDGIVNLGVNLNPNNLNATANALEKLIETADTTDSLGVRFFGGTLGQLNALTEAFNAAGQSPKEFISTLKEIDKTNVTLQNQTADVESRIARSGRYSPIVQKRAKQLLEIERQALLVRQQENQLVTLQQQLAISRTEDQRIATTQLIAEKERELQVSKANLEVIEESARQAVRIGDTIRNGLEEGFRTGLANLIKNNESSLKDTILGIAKSTLEATADTLSTIITERVFGQEGPATKIGNALKEGAEIVKTKIQEGFSSSSVAMSPSTGSSARGAINFTGTGVQVSSTMGSGEAMGETVVRSLEGSFTNFIGSFKDVFNKEAEGGFLFKLKNIFEAGSNLFGDIFSSIFSSLGGGSGIGGIFSSIIGGAVGGFRNGGIVSASMGGVASGPDSGFPAVLHGTEAVVPLPNGREIPVNLSGSGGTNNVTVNVAIDNNGNAQSNIQGDQQAGNLGKAIARAVQQELQNQKRSGGMLSPFGTA